MSGSPKRSHLMVVDLSDRVMVRTEIPQANHAALRSGFAGYPVNPRWSGSKFRAWKTGRQLREALAEGKIVVRPTDLMLVPAAKREVSPSLSVESPILATQLAAC